MPTNAKSQPLKTVHLKTVAQIQWEIIGEFSASLCWRSKWFSKIERLASIYAGEAVSSLSLSSLSFVVLYRIGNPASSYLTPSPTIFATPFVAKNMTGIPCPSNPAATKQPSLPGTSPILGRESELYPIMPVQILSRVAPLSSQPTKFLCMLWRIQISNENSSFRDHTYYPSK
jgi:hypothetical protein